MALADETKIGYILLALAPIVPPAILPFAVLKCHRSDVVGRGRTRSETVIASPENRAKYAIASYFLVLAHYSDPQALTRKAGCFG